MVSLGIQHFSTNLVWSWIGAAVHLFVTTFAAFAVYPIGFSGLISTILGWSK